ncbi:24362_t:CDS:1, partial [Gigaspora rosea]
TTNDSKSRGMPRLFKTFASCRPTSTKNGYDFSPPCTPTPPLDHHELSDDNNVEESEVEEISENIDENIIIDEKLQRQRKLKQGLLSKIFSSTSLQSSITTTPAARGSLSR